METVITTVTKGSLKRHDPVNSRPVVPGTMRIMNFVFKNLPRLRIWHVVYVLLVLAGLGISPDALADDERAFLDDASMDTAAEINIQEARWTYTKSVRLELLRNKHLSLETTIPLDRVEEPRLALAYTGDVNRNWTVSLSVWTSL